MGPYRDQYAKSHVATNSVASARADGNVPIFGHIGGGKSPLHSKFLKKRQNSSERTLMELELHDGGILTNYIRHQHKTNIPM